MTLTIAWLAESENDMASKTLTALLAETFKKPDENPSAFLQQLKALTPEDKAWFKKEFEKAGYEITESAPKAS